MKVLLSLLAAIVMLGGSLAAFAQPTTTGTITVLSGGTFSATLCTTAKFRDDGQNPVVSSATSATAEGSVGICYIDTKPYREAFTASISASDFTATTPGVNATISNENLYVDRVIRPRYASSNHSDPDAGTIYSVGSDGSTIGPATNQNGSSKSWTPFTYDLSQPRVVGRADAGVGIGVSDTQPVRPAVYLDLVIPAGQRPATYQTVITLTINPQDP